MANPTRDQLKALLAVEAMDDFLQQSIEHEILDECIEMGWIELAAGRGYVLADEGRNTLDMIRPHTPGGVG